MFGEPLTPTSPFATFTISFAVPAALTVTGAMIIAEITIVIVKIIDNDLLNFLFISIPPNYLFVQYTHNYCLDVHIIVYLYYSHIYNYCQVQNLILPLNTGDLMIKYTPFWETLEKSNESTYTLINKHNISSATIDRLRKNQGISTTKIDDLCKIFKCRVEDIIVFEDDEIDENGNSNK